MSDTTKRGSCGKSKDELRKEPKNCAKCKTVRYCSRECQQTDWKQHKKVCSSNAGERAANPDTSNQSSTPQAGPTPAAQAHGGQVKNLDNPVEKPFHKLNDKTWLHDRSEKDVFKLLIDSYRLRAEDDYNFGELDADSMYGGELQSGEQGFKRFLLLAKSKSKLNPPPPPPPQNLGWTPEKAKECVQFGRVDNDHGLASVVEKSDIMEYYGSADMPMQLRMYAEQVYGSGPGGQSGPGMMCLKMSIEVGRVGAH